MENLLKKYLKGDVTLWIVFIGLCILSTIEMYSASSTLAFKASSHIAPLIKHVTFLSLGALLAFFVHLVPYKYVRISSYLGLFLSFFLLIYVLFKGQSANDAARWISIAGFQFQPSELAKLCVLIVSADLISRIKERVDEKRYFWYVLFILMAICPLILLENFSTAFILFVVVYIMMFIGRVSFIRLASLAGVLVLALVLGFVIVKSIPKESMPKAFDRAYTWVGRIERFKTEKKDESKKYEINDDNRQVQHGRIAIARGGVFGVFPGNSVERDFLPQAYSDFIFSIIVEEMGLAGGIVVIILYLILLFRAGRIATTCASVFPALLVIGLSLMIVIQTFINMSVATSLIPVTGQPLPLISRGGTSIIITCIYFGIILGITRQIKDEQPYEATPEPEIDTTPVVDLDSL